MNLHGIFLHMVSDSMRSGCVILATWLRHGAAMAHAEAVTDLACAAAIAGLVLPLFRSTARVLLQSTPEEVHGRGATLLHFSPQPGAVSVTETAQNVLQKVR
jgi:Co/Zn/Cd efflux system component